MDKRDKEWSKLCSELVCDFANANTTDEAYLGLVEALEGNFDLSSGFAEKAKRVFPSLIDFKSSLNKYDKVVFGSILAERRLMDSINTQFEMVERTLEDYDSQRQTLVFRDMIYHAELVEGEIDGDLEYSKPFEEHISEVDEEIWKSVKPWTLREVKKLFKIGNTILRFKPFVSESRYVELKRFSKSYPVILGKHSAIQRTQGLVRAALGDVVTGKAPFESEPLGDFLHLYCKHCVLVPVFHSLESFAVGVDWMVEEHFSAGSKEEWRWLPYQKAVTYCVVTSLELLANRILIQKCDRCGNFFRRSKDNKNFIYCCKCSSKDHRSREEKARLQRERRKRLKEDKEQRLLEARIEHIVEKTGYPRQEVEEMIAAERELEKMDRSA